MKMPESVKLYHASIRRYGDLESLFADREALINYTEFDDNSGLVFYTSAKAAEEACRKDFWAYQAQLPVHIYETSIPANIQGMIDANLPLPDFYRQRFDELMSLELPVSPEILMESGTIERPLNFSLPFSKLRLRLSDRFGQDRADRFFKTVGIRLVKAVGEYTIIDPTILTGFERERRFDKEKFIRHLLPRFQKEKSSHYPIHGLDDVKQETAYDWLKKEFMPGTHGSVFLVIERDQDVRACLFEAMKTKFTDLTEADFNRYVEMRREILAKSQCLSFEFKKAKKYRSIPNTKEQLDQLLLRHRFHNAFGHGDVRLFERADNGQKFVVKKGNNKNKKAMRSEHEAYQIYAAFDVKVPKTAFFQNDKECLIIEEFIEGREVEHAINLRLLPRAEAQKLRDTIAEHFVIDALVGNYDAAAIHYSNLLLTPMGELYRIDAGAALGFNYNGFAKPSGGQDNVEWGIGIADFHFHRTRDERYQYRASNAAMQNYSGITNRQILDGLLKAETKLPAVKKAASKENYRIIEGRLKLAKAHFTKLCALEKRFESSNIKKTPIAKTHSPS